MKSLQKHKNYKYRQLDYVWLANILKENYTWFLK